jgi:hypothetical protein
MFLAKNEAKREEKNCFTERFSRLAPGSNYFSPGYATGA